MAQDDLPTFFAKRELLFNDDVPAATVNEVGQRFVAAERYNEALDFFEKSRNMEEVAKVAAIAFDNGDTAVWLRCKRMLGEEPDEGALQGLAERAEAQKKYMFAIEAWRRIGNEEQIERLRAALAAEVGDSTPSGS